VAEREASGDFDLSIGERAEAPGEDEVSDGGAQPEPAPPEEFGEPARNGAFDAFDADTWYFEPDPPPWYRRKKALTVWLAATAAAAALVVAAVLLILRSPGTTEDTPTSAEPTAPATTASSTEPGTSRPPAPSVRLT